MAQKPKAVAKARADIDFESELWNAVNELRGAPFHGLYCVKDFAKSFTQQVFGNSLKLKENTHQH